MAESVDTSHQTYIPERLQAIRRAYLNEINITLPVPESLLHSFAHVRSQTARKDHATAIMTEENKAIDTLFDQSPGYGTLDPSVFASAFDRHKWFMEREKYKSRLQKRMTDHMTKLAVSPEEWDEFGPPLQKWKAAKHVSIGDDETEVKNTKTPLSLFTNVVEALDFPEDSVGPFAACMNGSAVSKEQATKLYKESHSRGLYNGSFNQSLRSHLEDKDQKERMMVINAISRALGIISIAQSDAGTDVTLGASGPAGDSSKTLGTFDEITRAFAKSEKPMGGYGDD